MKCSSAGTDLKSSNICLSGRTHHPVWPKRAREVNWNVNSMLIVHYEFVPQGQTLNKLYYCNTLEHVWENIWWKQSVKWILGDWFLHCVSAPVDSAWLVHEFLARCKMTVISHPPYSINYCAIPSFFRNSVCHERDGTYWYQCDSCKIIECTGWYSVIAVLGVHQMVAWTLDLLCKVPRRGLESTVLIRTSSALLQSNKSHP
jgi:hypothetical protein